MTREPAWCPANLISTTLPAVRRGERVELGLVFLRPGGHPGAADPDPVVVGERGGHGADRRGTGGVTRRSGLVSWADCHHSGCPGNGRLRGGQGRHGGSVLTRFFTHTDETDGHWTRLSGPRSPSWPAS